MFNKVVICGMGVMGGSLGFFLVNNKKASIVHALVRKENTINQILKLKLAHKATTCIEDSLDGADLIVLAIPASAVKKQIKMLLPFLKKKMVVTDICSVKYNVVRDSERLIGDNAYFIGSHPMTGSEKFGFSNFIKDLYANTPCIITPTMNTSKTALLKLKNFWKSLNTDIFIMNPREHDLNVAFVSHLPHILSFLFMNLVAKRKEKDAFFKIAAGSFEDISRISGSSATLWADIFLNNKKQLSKLLKMYNKQIINFIELLDNEDSKAIIKKLEISGKMNQEFLNYH